MSDHVFNPVTTVPIRGLRSLFRCFFPMDVPREYPVKNLQFLSDEILRDIGVDPRDVPRPSEEEAFRLGLLDRGWRQPPHCSRAGNRQTGSD